MTTSHAPFANPGIALLCVDLQPIFLRAMENGDAVQRRCSLAIQAAVGLGMPIFFTEQVPEKLGDTDPVLRALAPAARNFAKSTFSAWSVEALAGALIDDRIEHILLCGLETPVCIYQSTLDLLSADIHVTLLSDCLAARRNADAAVCLAALIRAGAHVLPSETVFYSLLRDAGHPFFKSYTELVKRHSDPR